MLWVFRNNKKVRETSKKIHIVYDQGVITDRKVRNWFSKFRWEMNPDLDAPQSSIKML